MKYRFFLLLLFCQFSLSAQHSREVRELEKERLAALAEIEETNRLIKVNKETTSSTLNRLTLIAQQINSRKKIIRLLNQEIASLDKEICSKEMQIKTLEDNLEKKKQHYATSLRKMYLHKNNQDFLLFILSSKNFTQSFHRVMYLKSYSRWQKSQGEEIIKNQDIINEEKKLLITQRTDKLGLLSTRQTEENKLSIEEKSKKDEIVSLEKNKKSLLEELAKKEKQATALNRQIEMIIAEEVLKSEKAAKSASGENRTAEVQGGYVMTESERALSLTFANSQGKLPFPLKGDYKVVGFFGVHQHKELTKVVTNNNGIDIETTSDNEARAVFTGVVSRIFTFSGYNNSIIIRHGNYLTLYSNLDQVYVKQGSSVNAGQALGKIYTDIEKGNSTILHFEIWKEQTKLDPLSWLR